MSDPTSAPAPKGADEHPQNSSNAPAQAKSGDVLPPQAKPAEKSVGRELRPNDPVVLSGPMQRLVGYTVFRDIPSQVDAHALFIHLAAEFDCKTLLQTVLIQQLANDFVECRQYETARSAAILSKLGQAAREIVWPGFSDFYPPPVGTCEIKGDSITAYGEFLNSGGRKLINSADEDVIAEAKQTLAECGRPEADIWAEARLIALPQIEKLERMLTLKERAVAQKIEQLLKLGDRLRRPPAATKDASNGQ
jgi:hypothetical protein